MFHVRMSYVLVAFKSLSKKPKLKMLSLIKIITHGAP